MKVCARCWGSPEEPWRPIHAAIWGRREAFQEVAFQLGPEGGAGGGCTQASWAEGRESRAKGARTSEAGNVVGEARL